MARKIIFLIILLHNNVGYGQSIEYSYALETLRLNMNELDSLNSSYNSIDDLQKLINQVDTLYLFKTDSSSFVNKFSVQNQKIIQVDVDWLDSNGINHSFLFVNQILYKHLNGLLIEDYTDDKFNWVFLENDRIQQAAKYQKKSINNITFPSTFSRQDGHKYRRIYMTSRRNWGLVEYNSDNRKQPTFTFSLKGKFKWSASVNLINSEGKTSKVRFVGKRDRIKFYQISEGGSWKNVKKVKSKERIKFWW